MSKPELSISQIGQPEEIKKTENRIQYVEQELKNLSTLKDTIFHPEKLDNNDENSVHDIVKNISTRHFGVMAYHYETEKYNDLPDDDVNTIFKKRTYRQAILSTAQKLDFLGKKLLEPKTDFERELGFSSNPTAYNGEVEAIIVPGAAALSNYKRFYHAVKAISTGAIKTDTIIFAACERIVNANEHKTMANKGFSCGETEFELGLQAVNDIAGGFINGTQQTEEKEVLFNGIEYPVKVVSGKVLINGKEIFVKVVESPYDKTRKLENGQFTQRANTEETFISAMTVLDKDATNKTVCITSHDIWKPCQHVAAELIFGGYYGRKIISSGPDNCNRLYNNELGELDVDSAEAVVDEMSKYLYELEKLNRQIKNFDKLCQK